MKIGGLCRIMIICSDRHPFGAAVEFVQGSLMDAFDSAVQIYFLLSLASKINPIPTQNASVHLGGKER